MQTQCPHCQTRFHITDEQLQAAEGQVRCGECDQVFNVELLTADEIPVLEDTSQSELLVDELSIETLDEVELDAINISIPDLEPTELDENQLTFSPDEPEQEQETTVKLNQPSLHLVDTEKPSDDDIAPQPELDKVHISTLAINTDLQAANEHQEEEEVDEAIPTLVEQSEGYDASQLYPELETLPTAETQTMPTRIIITSLFLVVLLMAQSTFLLRDRLAEHGFRPLMQSLCASLNCELALPRAPQDMALKSREIRSHPNIKSALSVKAVINNQASFIQAYPLLQIQFHDIEGRIIAGRDFRPREYLPSDLDIKKGITPNNPVNIALELIDPGKNAVSFLFIFK